MSKTESKVNAFLYGVLGLRMSRKEPDSTLYKNG